MISESQEAAINALLDDELSEAEVAKLKAEADSDSSLKSALGDAQALKDQLRGLKSKEVPTHLTAALLSIPHRKTQRMAFRWLAAAAIVVAVSLTVYLEQQRDRDQQLAMAQQEMAVAMHYLRKTTSVPRRAVRARLDESLAEPVAEQTAKLLRQEIRIQPDRKRSQP